jgi:hypothetical protein
MIQDRHIDEAVAQGILTDAQAGQLRALAAGSAMDPVAARTHDADDERFRLIGGFNDVFVTIGVALLISAIFGLASVLDFRPGFAVIAMAAAWGLAEYFSRTLRLALPSIALAIMFAGASGFAATWTAGWMTSIDALPAETAWNMWILLFGLGTTLGAVAHERRFAVPIDWAIAACGLVFTVTAALKLAAPSLAETFSSAIAMALGAAIFAAGVRVDASDPARRTRRSDIAFWLHLVAAPMIVHAVMPLVTGGVSEINGVQAMLILLVFAMLGLVAIVIDRRALLVSGLIYAGIAIGYLLSQNVAESLGLSLTLLMLAGLVLGLSAGWKTLRRAILPRLPLGSLRTIFPPAT